MKWLLAKWVKKLLLAGFISLLILIIIIAGLTLYLNKILTYDKLSQITRKYSHIYLNRDLTFKNYNFNILKGIVLEDIHIEKNPDIEHTTEIFIKEINLRYNFKELIKLKFYVDKAVINTLELEINDNILKDELNYYKTKFNFPAASSITDENGNLIGKKEKFFNLRLIDIIDSRIIFKKDKGRLELGVNSIELDNSIIKKLKNDLVIDYNGEKIMITGDTGIYKNNAVLNWDIKLPARQLAMILNTETTNFCDFKIKTKINYQDDDYNISSIISKRSNKIIIPSLRLADNKNRIMVKDGIIRLDKPDIKFKLNANLKGVNTRNLKFLGKLDKTDFLADLDIDLLVMLFPGRLKDPLLKGNILVKNLKLGLGNEKFDFKKVDIAVINNKLKINNGELSYRGHDFIFNAVKENLFKNPFSYHVTAGAKKININKFLASDGVPFKSRITDMDTGFTLNIKEKNINFDTVNFKFLQARINMNGTLDFRDNSRLGLEFSPKIKNLALYDLFDDLNIKQDIRGTMNGELSVRGAVSDKKIQLEKLSGRLSSGFDLENIKNINVQASLGLNDNIINFYDSSMIFDDNKVKFSGSYETENKVLKIWGENNRILLSSIEFLKKKYDGKADFNFEIKKKMETASPLTAVASFNSPEVIYDNMKFKNISCSLTIDSNGLNGSMAVDYFYQGKINSKFQRDRDHNLKLSAEGKDISMEPMMKDWNNYNISGIFDFNLNYSIAGENTKGDFDIHTTKKGEMTDNPFQIELTRQCKDLLDFNLLWHKSILIQGKINNNIINFNKFDVICEDREISITGTYDIVDKKPDLLVKAKFQEEAVKEVLQQIQAGGLIKEEKNNWYYIKDRYLKNKFK